MSFLTSLIRSGIRRLGYDIIRYCDRMDLYNRPLNILELVVHSSFVQKQDFFFIQIGANDGKRSDPMRSSIIELRLPGLLVEPIPDLFEQLKQNYASSPQLSFENVAIARHNGEISLFRISPDAHVEDWVHGIVTYDRRWIEGMAKRRGLNNVYVEEIKVPTLTFKSLIQKYNIDAATLLQVDAEGMDLEIIKMAFDACFFPQIINFEFIHLSPKERVESRRLLVENGYRYVDIFRDTLALRNV